ncbi:Basic membrane lipoprotein Med, periplasmic binding protein (PBP1-ABC) superfamily [Anoxybacillus suryakundensis]|uniref:Basic membrane lipoprotein Med, periplasmic binding protein (PBP1-ABC) superfamily n=2 Tax=Anoxybacillus suryakundensis TaxID=1325335 RepID=A0A0K6GKT8_9BACL|nr:BMP family ABC transporter substrate-binding protein [Anoxybacillus suryakundensis]CUA79364.1 Basic membrane lipoprotein Med, periplasmic binding protein (PBP1-ABC) superfamily [Anoxybacillus suryakundensis]
MLMWRYTYLIFALLVILTSCTPAQLSSGNVQKVGLLVSDTIDDQVWGTKGYKGLLRVQAKFGVDVFYREGVNSKAATKQAVKEFHRKGVNLIFGHGNEYGEYFDDIAEKYPNVHFVFFNGEAKKKNVTSFQFKGHAMGFFGGMVAGHMTKTNKIGVIAAFEWQPEVDGFFEGALYENENVHVDVEYVQSWDDIDTAMAIVERMIADGVDIVYPAGDKFSVPIIEKMKEHGLYAIGYVTDQADLGERTVLTSTVQHVDALYELVAQKFIDKELTSGTTYVDFQDGVVELGTFSPLVDESFQQKITEAIERYKKTGKLPNE